MVISTFLPVEFFEAIIFWCNHKKRYTWWIVLPKLFLLEKQFYKMSYDASLWILWFNMMKGLYILYVCLVPYIYYRRIFPVSCINFNFDSIILCMIYYLLNNMLTVSWRLFCKFWYHLIFLWPVFRWMFELLYDYLY